MSKRKTVDLARYGDDWEGFLTDFVLAEPGVELDSERWERRCWAAYIALMRSDIPLSKIARNEVADRLEFLCTPKQQSKREGNLVKANALFDVIHTLADKLHQQGVRAPMRQAEEQVARQYGYASGKALNKWMRRNVVWRDRRTKPRPKKSGDKSNLVP